MPRELLNASITHVSYVDKGANQKQFFFTKSEDIPDFKKEVKVFINKDDNDERQLVYGVVYEPDVEDSHGDFMTADSIEKSAHDFVKDARNIDKQHDFESGVGEVVESYIAPTDFTLGEQEIVKGSWVLVTKASDEIWEEIKKGEITGYSMAGTAEVIEKEQQKKPVSKSGSNEDEEFKGFFNMLKGFFTGENIQKGAVADKYKKDRKRREFWAAQEALNAVIMNWDDWDSKIETDATKIREALQDYVDIVQEVLIEDDILKAVGSPPEGDEKMKAEDIAKMLDEKLDPINKRLDEYEKEEKTDGEDNGDKEGLLKKFSKALDEKLTPINGRLDNIEKSRGISKQADQDEDQGPSGNEDIEKGYMRHFS